MRIIASTIDNVEVGFYAKDGTEIAFRFDLRSDEASLMPLFSGPAWSAIIWERSVVAICKYLERKPSLVQDRYVVELGCGLGVPGLLCAVTNQANRVLLTDRAEDLAFLQTALRSNLHIPELSQVCAVPFDWSADAPDDVANTAQVILAVECVSADVYGRDSLDWLITAIEKSASKREPVLLLLCSVRRKNDGLEEVLRMVEIKFKAKSELVVDFSLNGVELHSIMLDLRA